jgi:hypothetical protein
MAQPPEFGTERQPVLPAALPRDRLLPLERLRVPTAEVKGVAAPQMLQLERRDGDHFGL